MLKKVISGILVISCITGCSSNAGPKETGGRFVGGVAGALLGSQFGHGSGRLVGVALGALAGSYLGGALGEKMDTRDQELAQRNMKYSLENAPDNRVSTWRNPNTQNRGDFTVTRTQEMPSSNKVCRDYVHTVVIGGQEEKVHGRACRDMRDTRGEWIVQQ